MQHLEKSVSQWLLVERWGWDWLLKDFWWSFYYIPALLRGQASSPCHDFLVPFLHKTQNIHVILSSLCSTCSKWMHFQHVLSSWELQQITNMYLKKKSPKSPWAHCYGCLYLHVTLIRIYAELQLQRENLIL